MRIAVFDLDGTLLKNNSSFAFCIYLYKKGIFSFSDFCTVLVTYLSHKYCGFSLLWLHAKVFCRLFKDKDFDFFNNQFFTFLDENLNNIVYHPAIKKLEEEKATGSEIWVFSSSPAFIVKEIARRLGIENVYATEYVLDSQKKFRGIVKLIDGMAKALKLNEIENHESIAYSDSILDLPLLEMAQSKVAVKPDRALKKIAKKSGWEII